MGLADGDNTVGLWMGICFLESSSLVEAWVTTKRVSSPESGRTRNADAKCQFKEKNKNKVR